jgi:uncharacterized protein (DUF736 family)
MSGYNNDNRGVLFFEENKRSDRAPDLTGFVEATEDMIGKTVQLAGWDRRGHSGKRFISVQFAAPRSQDTVQDCAPGAGTLLQEHTKTNPKAPDFRGAAHIPANLAGKKIRLAAWKNHEDGSMRLAIEEQRARSAA